MNGRKRIEEEEPVCVCGDTQACSSRNNNYVYLVLSDTFVERCIREKTIHLSELFVLRRSADSYYHNYMYM